MNINHGFMWIMLLIAGLALSACSDNEMATGGADGKMETALQHTEKHLDPKYVCPMHPQIIRDKPGNCPICGMDLIKKEAEQSTSSGEKKILYWVAPMDPAYRRDEPGKSPMGMDLVPVYDEGDGTDVRISAAVENNMGVRTGIVERKKLWRRIDTVGYVDFDENKISHIHIRSKGWIEKLVVQSEGVRVKKGQLLFDLYSPELVNAQEDYLQAVRTGNKFLRGAARERLLALGISEKQIKEISRKNRVDQFVSVYAPQDGIVAKLMVREGMYITPMMEVMSLADLSTIWILAEVFESQANWVKEGQPADVKLSYVPGREWEGKVEYIYPSLNQKTRTLKVRLRFDNPDEVLKPNMFADVSIYGGAKKDVLIIPREALIRAGASERVILAVGKGRFRPAKVVVGIESGDWIEIKSGLTEGDRVVTSGQFLIDSEASLKASLQRMQSPAGSDQKKQETMQMDDSSQMKQKSSAEQKADAKQMEGQSQMQQVAKENIIGRGVIREILAADNKLKLSHDPIPALKWPEMTMYFKVKPDVKLDGLALEDKVEFELEGGDDGFVIKAIRKTGQ